ncbi:hypothetical protein E2C01_082903 [Portunus trituberculatus]|uniref:Uncharacterized protein n=1 Tax=Portunus trituberculatus TaxID=210409 RepID=A0A5B7J6C0_PORTR|nr:hypothetical protein [Portunus trituberculatus]
MVERMCSKDCKSLARNLLPMTTLQSRPFSRTWKHCQKLKIRWWCSGLRGRRC